MTVSEVLRAAERRLSEAGIETAALDAETLLRHVLRWDRARVIASFREPLAAGVARRFDELVRDRATRRPLQYVIGRQAFWRHDFEVTPDVLIPRPETELLVEAALAGLKDVASPVVVDVGTGSGCIAVSIAADRPDARVIGVDLSPAALAVARRNADAAGVGGRLEWREGDLLSPVADLRGRIHLVAANPPYADPSEQAGLPPEVRDHEPMLAVVAPGDRCSVYRRLVPASRDVLAPGGGLLLEVGFGMADAVASLCADAGFTIERIIPDLQSIPRTIVARRR
jgi:release factor glutamine methyltransferase